MLNHMMVTTIREITISALTLVTALAPKALTNNTATSTSTAENPAGLIIPVRKLQFQMIMDQLLTLVL